jgi:hypothetical protein
MRQKPQDATNFRQFVYFQSVTRMEDWLYQKPKEGEVRLMTQVVRDM